MGVEGEVRFHFSDKTVQRFLIIGEKLVATIESIQADLADVSSSIDGLSVGMDRISAEIQALKDQIASGGVVTQADLDAVGAVVSDVRAKARAALAKEQDL